MPLNKKYLIVSEYIERVFNTFCRSCFWPWHESLLSINEDVCDMWIISRQYIRHKLSHYTLDCEWLHLKERSRIGFASNKVTRPYPTSPKKKQETSVNLLILVVAIVWTAVLYCQAVFLACHFRPTVVSVLNIPSQEQLICWTRQLL